MTHPAELSLQKRATAAFIAADPTAGAVWRYAPTPNGAGGARKGTATLALSATVRLVPQGNKGDTSERQLLDGKTVIVTHHLIGETGLDVRRGDEIRCTAGVFDVIRVWTPGNYEVKAEVSSRG